MHANVGVWSLRDDSRERIARFPFSLHCSSGCCYFSSYLFETYNGSRHGGAQATAKKFVSEWMKQRKTEIDGEKKTVSRRTTRILEVKRDTSTQNIAQISMRCIQILYSYNEAKRKLRQLRWIPNGTSESLTMNTNTFFIWLYFVTRTYLVRLCVRGERDRTCVWEKFKMTYHSEWHCYRSRTDLNRFALILWPFFFVTNSVQFVLSVCCLIFYPIFSHISFILFALGWFVVVVVLRSSTFLTGHWAIHLHFYLRNCVSSLFYSIFWSQFFSSSASPLWVCVFSPYVSFAASAVAHPLCYGLHLIISNRKYLRVRQCHRSLTRQNKYFDCLLLY